MSKDIPTTSAVPQADVPLLSPEEEDAIIHTRITNDERALRRVVKKFHTYNSLAHTPIIQPSYTGSVDDAREAFLTELASFQLALRKSMMVCEAETRQVEEYERERQKIEQEHDSLRAQIEELKVALEHAHMERRRKMEYDLVAEKINTLPSREELEQSIQALESDIHAIHTEHDTQDRTIRGQKSALDNIVLDLGSLRLMGKDKDVAASRLASPAPTPLPDSIDTEDLLPSQSALTEDEQAPSSAPEIGEVDEREEGEDDESVDVPLASKLNPVAKEFVIHSQNLSTPSHSHRQLRSTSRGKVGDDDGDDDDDDIEMGEVAEDPKVKMKKKLREDLEEGEASDSSSALSDPPDD
ncbi:Tho complex subunit 7-domain-containing protein [Hygrophoropsis aurantiaca]|uniref:Tho complex subunit 7-domain-containing protein n=1 Tax=Hygrophoropsis aurantiaca TaxID=72124 RepID=A0ACB8AMB8_9AGAM|nr:Tho complex subunit 7-domain-containing protein [Hygrophoropsis aurantiaca]